MRIREPAVHPASEERLLLIAAAETLRQAISDRELDGQPLDPAVRKYAAGD